MDETKLDEKKLDNEIKENKEDDSVTPEKPTSFLKEVLSWVQVIVIAAVIAFLLNTFIIANSTVPSASMETTIMTGDRIIGTRFSYIFGEPKRGDITIFRWPDNESIYFVKRIIGLPGETVTMVQDDPVSKVGHVEVDGVALDEPYINGIMLVEDSMNGRSFSVPADSYFCMGDNRNNSADARYWINTYVTKKKLIAKVQFEYYPKFKSLK